MTDCWFNNGRCYEAFAIKEDVEVFRQGKARVWKGVVQDFRYFCDGQEVNIMGEPCLPPKIATFRKGVLRA